MTPTASSTSTMLLTPSASATKATVGTDAQATAGEGLDGFELLLGSLQQLQQSLAVGGSGAKGESPELAGADQTNGNALPIDGNALPLPELTLPLGFSDQAAQTLSDEDKKTADDSDGAAVADIGMLLFGTASPAAAKASAASAGQSAAGTQAAGASMQNESAPADGVTLTLAADQPYMRGGDRVRAGETNRAGNDALATAAATPGDDATSPVVAAAVASQAGEATPSDTDFDRLLKHFDTATSNPSPTGITSGVNEGSATNHASRAYANAMNSSASVPVPVGDPGWGDAVADKVMWFSANNLTSAEIHLNPPDLGPLQVRVSTQHDQASVVFTSQHAAVREALDQALPRLRDMMSGQGMQLLDVSVGGQTSQQQQQFAHNGSSRGGQSGSVYGEETAEGVIAEAASITTTRLARAGVDAYV